MPTSFSWTLNPAATPTPTPAPSLPGTVVTYGATSYTRQLKALLPPGVLWNLEEDSNLTAVLQAIADELARVDARGADLIDESDPRTATETLEDWERVLSIPDERVTEIPGTTAGRRVAITAKFTSRGGQNRAFFESLCAACGYPVNAIDLYTDLVLRAGFRVGDRVYGTGYAYSMLITLDPSTPGALPQADFERVVRGVTHAHITVLFEYL